MARPQNLVAYGSPDAAVLAAAYGFGIAKNHAFVDGNKRTTLVALELFLALNAHTLAADDRECVIVMLSVASGAFSEEELAEWIRRHLQPV